MRDYTIAMRNRTLTRIHGTYLYRDKGVPRKQVMQS